MDMKTTQWIKTGVVAAMMAIATACGGSKPSPETQATSTSTSTSTSTPQATPNPAQAAQQMAEAMQKATGQTQTAPAVDFEKLVALLPEPTGWTRSKPRGEQMSMGVSMSKAEASYEKGESSVRLEITDSSFNQLLLAPMSMMLMSTYSERSSEGYKKAASSPRKARSPSWSPTALWSRPGAAAWTTSSRCGRS
jgi:hypothetical protein